MKTSPSNSNFYLRHIYIYMYMCVCVSVYCAKCSIIVVGRKPGSAGGLERFTMEEERRVWNV